MLPSLAKQLYFVAPILIDVFVQAFLRVIQLSILVQMKKEWPIVNGKILEDVWKFIGIEFLFIFH